MVVVGLAARNSSSSQYNIERTETSENRRFPSSRRKKTPSDSENKENNMLDDNSILTDNAGRYKNKYNRGSGNNDVDVDLTFSRRADKNSSSCLLCDTLINEQLCYHDDKLKRFHRCHSDVLSAFENNRDYYKYYCRKNNSMDLKEAPLWFHEIQRKTDLFRATTFATEESAKSQKSTIRRYYGSNNNNNAVIGKPSNVRNIDDGIILTRESSNEYNKKAIIAVGDDIGLIDKKLVLSFENRYDLLSELLSLNFLLSDIAIECGNNKLLPSIGSNFFLRNLIRGSMEKSSKCTITDGCDNVETSVYYRKRIRRLINRSEGIGTAGLLIGLLLGFCFNNNINISSSSSSNNGGWSLLFRNEANGVEKCTRNVVIDVSELVEKLTVITKLNDEKNSINTYVNNLTMKYSRSVVINLNRNENRFIRDDYFLNIIEMPPRKIIDSKKREKNRYSSEFVKDINKTVADFDETLKTLEALINNFCLESIKSSVVNDDDGVVDDNFIGGRLSIINENVKETINIVELEDDYDSIEDIPAAMKNVLGSGKSSVLTPTDLDYVCGLFLPSIMEEANFCEYNLWYSPLMETNNVYEKLLKGHDDPCVDKLKTNTSTVRMISDDNGDYELYRLWGSPLVEGGIFQWIKQNRQDCIKTDGADDIGKNDKLDAIYNLWSSSPNILKCLRNDDIIKREINIDDSNYQRDNDNNRNNNYRANSFGSKFQDRTKFDNDVDRLLLLDDRDATKKSRLSDDDRYLSLSTQPALAWSISFENVGLYYLSSSDDDTVVSALEDNNRTLEMSNSTHSPALPDLLLPAITMSFDDDDQQDDKDPNNNNNNNNNNDDDDEGGNNTESNRNAIVVTSSRGEGFSLFCDHTGLTDSYNENTSSMGSMYSLFGENIDYGGSSKGSPSCSADIRTKDRIVNPLLTTFDRLNSSKSIIDKSNDSRYDEEDRLLFYDIGQQKRQLEIESDRDRQQMVVANSLNSSKVAYPRNMQYGFNDEYNLFPNDHDDNNNNNNNVRYNNEMNEFPYLIDSDQQQQQQQLSYLDSEVERINFPLSLRISLSHERYLFKPIEPAVSVKLDPAPVYAKSPNGSLYYDGYKMAEFKHPNADSSNNVFRPKFVIIQNDKACQTECDHRSMNDIIADQICRNVEFFVPEDNNFYEAFDRSNNLNDGSSTNRSEEEANDDEDDDEIFDLQSTGGNFNNNAGNINVFAI